MKKIMFNDRYGLTRAVLDGKKTMTRRILDLTQADEEYLDEAFDWDLRESVILDRYAQYEVGEIVAVAQSYGAVYDELFGDVAIIKSQSQLELHTAYILMEAQKATVKGWNNKMFVRPNLMPHYIQFTDRRIERLQSISDDDCLKEGIIKRDDMINSRMEDIVRFTFENSFERHVWKSYATPREAFARLIDKVSKKGTWDRNPYTIAYSFEIH